LIVSPHATRRWRQRAGSGRGSLTDRLDAARFMTDIVGRFNPERKGRSAYYVKGRTKLLVQWDGAKGAYVLVTVIDRLSQRKQRSKESQVMQKRESQRGGPRRRRKNNR
jgi:hypothetical protein